MLGFKSTHVSYSKNRIRRGGKEEKIYVKHLHFDHLGSLCKDLAEFKVHYIAEGASMMYISATFLLKL